MSYNFSLSMENMIMYIATDRKEEAAECWFTYRELFHTDLGKDVYSRDEVEQEMKRRMKVQLLRFFPDVQQKCKDFFMLDGCSYGDVLLTTEEQKSTYEPFKLVADELQEKIREIQKREKEIFEAQEKAGKPNEVCRDSTELIEYSGGGKAVYT